MTHSLEDSLEQGLIDVALILQSLAQELETFPITTITSLNRAQFKKFFIENFSSWDKINPNRVGSNIYSLYDHESADTDYLYYTIMTDISFTVGTIEIAQKAAIGYKSPVYLSFIKHRPSHHFPNPSGSLKYAFHFWDYISLVNINYLPFLNKENDDHPKFIASKEVIEFGNNLRHEIFYFIFNGGHGQIKNSSWKTINNIQNITENYNAVLHISGFTSHIENFNKYKCNKLKKMEIDDRFWIIN